MPVHSKLPPAVIAAILLLSALSAFASGTVSVGVRRGDWIEYNVAFTGNASLGHDVTWARMDVVDVRGSAFTLNITIQSSNGTLLSEQYLFDFETGQLGDNFVIPADLNKGDTFFNAQQGNITITGIEEKTVAGAERTIIWAATSDTTYYWDRSTGVLVEATSTYPFYSMTTKVNATNMWQPQLFGVNPTIIYALVAGAVTAALIATVLFLLRRKNRPSKPI
jgi:hypothetical protein